MPRLADINYQPLNAIKRSLTLSALSLRKNYSTPLLIAWLAPVVAIPISAVITILSAHLINVALWLVVGSFFPLVILIGLQLRSDIKKGWLGFAAANGWQISDTAPYTPPGLEASQMPSESDLPMITANVDSVSFDLLAKYVRSNSDAREASMTWCLTAYASLPNELPYIVLRAKYGVVPRITNKEIVEQPLKLEGDFNQHYDVHIEQGKQVEALQVLTPDIMQLLVRWAKPQPMQLIIWGKELYVMNNNVIYPYTTELMQQLVPAAVELTSQLTENLSLTNPVLGRQHVEPVVIGAPAI